jgi:hypothetical protein
VQVIKVPGAGATASTPTPGVTTGKSAKVKTSSRGGGGAKKPAAAAAAGSGGGAATVLHPTQNLPPATVQVGGACHGADAGCKNGKFTGNFFGE